MIYGHRLRLGKAIFDAIEGFTIGRTGLTMPTMALWRINRYAARISDRFGRKQFIYALKNAYIQMLYERGCCTRVILETQKLECWHTRAYSEGWDDYCPKCDNTGVYAEHELYRFTFDVDGCWYSWHQPVRLVNYPVRLHLGHNEFWGRIHAPYDEDGYIEGLKGCNIRHDIWTVWWCLILNGYKVPSPFRLYRDFGPLNRLQCIWSSLSRFIRVTNLRDGIQRCSYCDEIKHIFGHRHWCKCSKDEIPF